MSLHIHTIHMYKYVWLAVSWYAFWPPHLVLIHIDTSCVCRTNKKSCTFRHSKVTYKHTYERNYLISTKNFNRVSKYSVVALTWAVVHIKGALEATSLWGHIGKLSVLWTYRMASGMRFNVLRVASQHHFVKLHLRKWFCAWFCTLAPPLNFFLIINEVFILPIAMPTYPNKLLVHSWPLRTTNIS